MDLSSLSSNWKKLQASLQTTEKSRDTPKAVTQHGVKRKRQQPPTSSKPPAQVSNQTKKPQFGKTMAQEGHSSIKELEIKNGIPLPRLPDRATAESVNAGLSPSVEVGKYVAIDCEMVGVGPNPGRQSALARVSIVNYNGDQVYDSYVIPVETVTDWRTHVSGIAPKHMKHARPLAEVRADVERILKDRIIVGHAIRHDLEALMLTHPKRDIRDTARHLPYRKLAGGGSPRLKILASELLGCTIQEGEHSSIEDARATMLLFRRDKAAFDREHAKKWPARPVAESQESPNGSEKPRKPTKKKKKKR
ncbi:3'-5' exonuclease [Exophiala dermatitidis]|uniref:RNA exonuclease 4 n=2 Tax=Exophiala dermatitidis TaxID=5970 RepID=H6C6J9_EXODN|nr:uncharacterized protein HMPREF1120_07337 [Exophiala dermatitidis NIH/UT8656]KAJ4526191.1 3'-5' exonuclease [Exophiala dermatitidis]EHY59345.1 hypothetical protein HMPREF1120_07337 [Exophiala dermatitidis NIH/UT8656]KAJ4526865.1 3'-5' exonuclease [Exophiala dermatitidis]KAJ4532573.1 3'-5' exonuclease [Exophiala dermatitidis]KAJ4546914.1 3'-5' exonuclease [Exophiala dermatitidis]